MENVLKGVLGFKGEKGDSAYTVAVKNGFIGSEKDWLANLGTSSHFKEYKVVHTATAGQTSLEIPESYTSNSQISVYVNGFRLNTEEYSLNLDTNKIELLGLTLDDGTVVEIVVQVMSTNELPIVENINESSTSQTVPSTKAVYDNIKDCVKYPVGAVFSTTSTEEPSVLLGESTWNKISTETIGERTVYYWERVS